MSTALSVVQEAATTNDLLASGILDWTGEKVAELETLFRAISVVAGIGFVIWRAVSTRGAMAAVVIAGLAAGVFIFIVWNVTQLQDMVDEEVNGAPASTWLLEAGQPPLSGV